MEIKLRQLIWWILKYRIRYPRFGNKSMHISEPNVFSGLTDHPLDRNAAPVADLFTLLRKYIARTPVSILSVDSVTRNENSFTFKAYGFNILRNRTLGLDYVEYETDKPTECILKIDILTDTSYRLRLTMGKHIPTHETPMIYSDVTNSSTNVTLAEDEGKYVISTPEIKLQVSKENFGIKVLNKNNELITESGSRTHNEFFTATDAFPLGFVKNRKPKRLYATENFNLYPGESIFGLGEKFGSMNRVGQTISLWTHDGVGNTSGRAYKHVPFFLSSRGYGVFFNEANPLTFWVGSREVTKILVAAENNLTDYYFFFGPTPKQVLQQYTSLTGRAHMPPRWSFGTWMSRLSYSSQEEVFEVAKKIRDERFPCDVIHIDVNWFTDAWTCDWQFDETRFPDPAHMFQSCADLGFKISLWQIPYVMDSLRISKDARSKKALAKNHGPFLFLTLGSARAIDFSRPEGVTWYKEKLKPLFELGAKVMKVDFGEQIEPHQEFEQYSGKEMHNLYPLLYNKAAFEATEESLGKGKAMIWARSAYAGSQRYPVHWSGDNSSNYHNTLASIRGGLSMGLCGFTFWSQDVGGFVGIPDDKLYVRWTGLCIFQSHIRFHGCEPKYREPWNFSSEAQDFVRKFLEFRYQLIPYLFSESIKASKEGLPLLKHLLLEFPEDPTCYNIEDQFFSGDLLLVAPIFTEHDDRRVYIPLGEWYDFWTGEMFKGPTWLDIEDVPLDKVPLFVRAGSFLPLGEIVQSVPEELPNKLTLHAFPGSMETLEYTMYDELGSINFKGRLVSNILKVEVSYNPKDRSTIELDIQMPKDYRSIKFEIQNE